MNKIDEVITEIEHLDDAIKNKHIPSSHYNIKTNLKPLWKLSKNKAQLLQQLTKEQNPTTILELGTSSGYSTLHLRKAAPQATIYTIEFDPKKVVLAKHHFKKANANITIIEARVHNALNMWSTKLDLVFMDCDKDYLHYFNTLKPYLNNNALIIADNTDKCSEFKEAIPHAKEQEGLFFFRYKPSILN